MPNQKKRSHTGAHALKNRLIAISLFFLLSSVVIFAYRALESKEDQARTRLIEAHATTTLQIINLDLQKRVRSLERLVKRWEVRNGTPRAEFETDAFAILTDDPGYQAIEWVDKSFHVQWIIPLKGNEQAQGLNLGFEKKRLIALQQARDKKLPTMTSAIDLIQGGKGFLVYNPIFVDNEFEGFVLAVFRTQELLEHLIGAPENQVRDADFVMQVLMDGDTIFTEHGWDDVQEKSWERQEEATILNHHFSIKVRPTKHFLIKCHTMLPELILIAGILLSFLVSIIAYLFWKASDAVQTALIANASLEFEIEKRKNTESRLARERQRLECIIDGTRIGTWEWNVQTGETTFNEEWANIIGYTLSEISPVSIETWIKFVHPDDLKVSGELLEKNFNEELDYYECEARMQHKNGEWVWVLDRGQVYAWTDDGKPLLMFGTHQDITERKQFEEKIQHLATHDALTGLVNLRVAQDNIQMALKRAKRNKTLVAILFIDLDSFKGINDNHGHDAGDYVLKEVAGRLVSCVRESDTVARIGGDEFLIVLSDLTVAGHAAEVANKGILSVSHPIDFKGAQLMVGASIGIALYPSNGDNPKLLLKMADEAMYATKKSGKNGYSFAESDSDKNSFSV